MGSSIGDKITSNILNASVFFFTFVGLGHHPIKCQHSHGCHQKHMAPATRGEGIRRNKAVSTMEIVKTERLQAFFISFFCILSPYGFDISVFVIVDGQFPLRRCRMCTSTVRLSPMKWIPYLIQQLIPASGSASFVFGKKTQQFKFFHGQFNPYSRDKHLMTQNLWRYHRFPSVLEQDPPEPPVHICAKRFDWHQLER